MDSVKNRTHAWKGAWNRPMEIDEDLLHPFTVARMTDHNVRGLGESSVITERSRPEIETGSTHSIYGWKREVDFIDR